MESLAQPSLRRSFNPYAAG